MSGFVFTTKSHKGIHKGYTKKKIKDNVRHTNKISKQVFNHP